MMERLEKLVELQKRTDSLVKDIEKETEKAKAENQKSREELKKIVEIDMEEIVGYCINMNCTDKNSTAVSPTFIVELSSDVTFQISYDKSTDTYKWYLGKRSYDFGWTTRIGLFFNWTASTGWYDEKCCGGNAVPLGKAESIYYNWAEYKERLIKCIVSAIELQNRVKLDKAMKNLEKETADSAAFIRELKKSCDIPKTETAAEKNREEKLVVPTAAGDLLAYKGTDPQNPSICLMFKPKGEDVVVDLAYAEVTDNNGNIVTVHEFRDERSEDCTDSFDINVLLLGELW